MPLNSFGNYLRSTIKSILMDGYSKSLPNIHPVKHKKCALTGCRLYDGLETKLKKNMTILIEDDIIVDVDNNERLKIPEGYMVVDLSGQTIMPGMIDSHTHICSPFFYDINFSAIRQLPSQILLNFANTITSGITTVCDMGGLQGFIKEFSNLSDQNIISGPRLENCFTLISPKKGRKLGYPSQVKLLDPFSEWLFEGQVATRPKSVKELKRICSKVKNDGGSHLKITYQPYPFSKLKNVSQSEHPIFDDDWMKVIFETSKELDLVVDIHAPFAKSAEKCVDLAIASDAKIRLHHISFDRDLTNTFFKKMSDHGFYIIPTVMVYGDAFHLPEFIKWIETNPQGHLKKEPARQMKMYIQNAIDLEQYSGQCIMELDYKYIRDNFDIVKRNTQNAHDSKVIGIGSDMGGTYTGFFGRLFSEISYYLDFGIDFKDILRYLTSANATINQLNDRGVIKKGKLADIIGLIGDPLDDPHALKKVATVVKGGSLIKLSEMSSGPIFNR